MNRFALLAMLLGIVVFAAGCPQEPGTPDVDTGGYETPDVPAVDKPAEEPAEEPPAEEPAMEPAEDPLGGTLGAEPPTVDFPIIVPSMEEPAAEEPPAEEPPADEPAVEEPAPEEPAPE